MKHGSLRIIVFRVSMVVMGCYLVVFAAASFGVPVPVFDMEKILRSSDLVAVVKPSEPFGKAKVIAVYQGKAMLEGGLIEIATDNPEVSSGLKNKGDICIFLKKAPEGEDRFEVASEYYTFFRVVPERRPENIGGKKVIELELLQGLRSNDSGIVEDSVLWLRRMKSAKGKEEIVSLAESKSAAAVVRAFALEMRIPEGDKEVIKDALGFLEETSEYRGRAKWRFDVVWAFSKIEAGGDVEFLSRLLVEAPGDVARALAFSSREWGDGRSIPFLIRGMERLDKEGSLRCILCLSKITGRPVPSHKEFMADPRKYIVDWQKWWRVGEPAVVTQSVGEERPDRREASWSWLSFLIGAVPGVGIAALVVLLTGKGSGVKG